MKEQRERVLCVKGEEYGTLDLWINDEAHWKFGNDDDKYHIIATFNGESIDKGMAYMITLDGNPIKALDSLMGYISRDTQNWGYKDIVIHWGKHTWKFYNSKNITKVEREEYIKTLDDISFYYDVEI